MPMTAKQLRDRLDKMIEQGMDPDTKVMLQGECRVTYLPLERVDFRLLYGCRYPGPAVRFPGNVTLNWE